MRTKIVRMLITNFTSSNSAASELQMVEQFSPATSSKIETEVMRCA